MCVNERIPLIRLYRVDVLYVIALSIRRFDVTFILFYFILFFNFFNFYCCLDVHVLLLYSLQEEKKIYIHPNPLLIRVHVARLDLD